MIRVVVADDQRLVRASLAALIDAEPDIDVVGQACHGAEAVDLVRRVVPDVVLLDIRMPVCDGLEATRRIVADPALRGVRVCILTMFELDDYIFGALQAGAAGFLLKDADPQEVADAIRRLARGDQILSQAVLSRVIERSLTGAGQPDAALGGITERERQVLALVGVGLTNAEIEQRLFISRGTLKTHIGHLLAKLQARDRVQLVIIAHQAGLVGGLGGRR